jgi:hypothetical protein
MMTVEPREKVQELFRKTVNRVGRPILQTAQIEHDPNHWSEAVVVRPVVDACFEDPRRALDQRSLGTSTDLFKEHLAHIRLCVHQRPAT